MFIFLIPAIIVILIVYAVSINNIAVRKQNEVEKAFGSVDAMLKKCYDLIPNLVEKEA